MTSRAGLFRPCLYVASTRAFEKENVWKFGITGKPRERLSTYVTGCPPGREPSSRMEYRLLFETKAGSKAELRDEEDELANAFVRFRLMWRIPGDSEWFAFPAGTDALAAVANFVTAQPWYLRQLQFEEVRYSRLLARNYHKNTKILRAPERNRRLSELQEPEIEKLRAFLVDPVRRCGYYASPCGSGKSRMACLAVARAGIQRCLVVCPTVLVEEQWAREMEAAFGGGEIKRYAHTTEADLLGGGERLCLIINRASAAGLLELLGPLRLQLVVMDEAHHFAGEVTTEAVGAGSTRAIVLKTGELGIKQLGLTYTPRVVRGEKKALRVISMDDEALFGARIGGMRLKDLVSAGVLPDYRIWTLRDPTSTLTGLPGKIALMAEAWNAREGAGKNERFILNHLVVFTRDNREAREISEGQLLEAIFRASEDMENTKIIRVEGGQDLTKPLEEFASAPRAILLNCKVLGEGADIPAADSVLITYHKESRGEITQMVLRPGRWREGKPLFHVLIPLLGEDDLAAFEEVLTSLASFDVRLEEEIVRRTRGKPSGRADRESEEAGAGPELVVVERYEGLNPQDVERCFANARKALSARPGRFGRAGALYPDALRRFCSELGIDNSLAYAKARANAQELPEDPRENGVSWYSFFHPTEPRMSAAEFGAIIARRGLGSAEEYEASRGEHPEWPTLQHIHDGYFEGCDRFETLKEKYAPGAALGRRR